MDNLTDMIASMGGKVIEDSSLTSTEKGTTETDEAGEKGTVEKPVETGEKTTTTATTETATEKPVEKATETATEKTTTDEKLVEVTPDAEPEKRSYKGYDIVSNIDKEFREEYGMSISTAQEIVSVDYDNDDMDERDIVTDYLYARNEGITEKEIEAKLRKFNSLLFKPQSEIDKMLEEGTLTTEAFNDLDAEWLGLMREAKTYLKSVQNKVKENLDNFEVEQEFNSTPTNEAGKKLVELTNTFLPTYSNVSVDIVDKDGKKVDTINYATDEAGKKLVSEIVSDPSNVYKLWMDEKGVIDVQKMAKDIYNLRNRDKIDKAVYDHAYAKGASTVVKEQSNIDFSTKKTNTGEGQSKLDPNMLKLINNFNGY
jgi:hypothetical protein